MPLVFRSTSSVAEVASGNITLSEPTGAANGDLLVAFIGARGNAAFTVPSGWTVVDTAQNSGDTDATNGIASGVMCWQVRNGTPNLTWNRTGGDVARGSITAYQPNNGETITFDTGVAETRATVGEPAASAISLAEPGELVVYGIAHGDTNTSTTDYAAATQAPLVPSSGSNAQCAAFRPRFNSSTSTGADLAISLADFTAYDAGTTGAFSANAATTSRSVNIVGAWKTGWASDNPKPVKQGTTGRNVGSASVSTGSFTPPANTLLVAFIHGDTSNSSALSEYGSIAGGSLTWTRIGFVADQRGTSNYGALHAFWAVTGGSPSSMSVTFTHGLGTQQEHQISCWAVPGADTSSPVGAYVENEHLTSATSSYTLGATPAGSSLIFAFHGSYDTSAGSSFGVQAGDEFSAIEDSNVRQGFAAGMSISARFGGTGTSLQQTNCFYGGAGETIATADLTAVMAFEIKKAASGNTYNDSLSAAGTGDASTSTTATRVGTMSEGGTSAATVAVVASTFVGAFTATATGAASVTNVGVLNASLDAAGTGDVSISGGLTLEAAFSAAATGDASTSAALTRAGDFTAAGTGDAAFTSVLSAVGSFSASGTGDASVTSIATMGAAFSAAGTGDGTLAGVNTMPVSLTASGTGDASITGGLVLAGLLTAAGTGDASFEAVKAITAELTASATGAASTSSTLTAAADFSAALTGGAATAASGLVAGTLTAGGTGAATLTAVLSAVGQVTAAGAGAATFTSLLVAVADFSAGLTGGALISGTSTGVVDGSFSASGTGAATITAVLVTATAQVSASAAGDASLAGTLTRAGELVAAGTGDATTNALRLLAASLTAGGIGAVTIYTGALLIGEVIAGGVGAVAMLNFMRDDTREVNEGWRADTDPIGWFADTDPRTWEADSDPKTWEAPADEDVWPAPTDPDSWETE